MRLQATSLFLGTVLAVPSPQLFGCMFFDS